MMVTVDESQDEVVRYVNAGGLNSRFDSGLNRNLGKKQRNIDVI